MGEMRSILPLVTLLCGLGACLLLVVSAGALCRPRPVVYASATKDVGAELS